VPRYILLDINKLLITGEINKPLIMQFKPHNHKMSVRYITETYKPSSRNVLSRSALCETTADIFLQSGYMLRFIFKERTGNTVSKTAEV